LKFPLRAFLFMIRGKLRESIGVRGCATWDLDKVAWGGRGECIGTVPMSASVQEGCMGVKGFWRENRNVSSENHGRFGGALVGLRVNLSQVSKQIDGTNIVTVDKVVVDRG
nr:hypothetical protein [Tanacetum cinerariifolium]